MRDNSHKTYRLHAEFSRPQQQPMRISFSLTARTRRLANTGRQIRCYINSRMGRPASTMLTGRPVESS